MPVASLLFHSYLILNPLSNTIKKVLLYLYFYDQKLRKEEVR